MSDPKVPTEAETLAEQIAEVAHRCTTKCDRAEDCEPSLIAAKDRILPILAPVLAEKELTIITQRRALETERKAALTALAAAEERATKAEADKRLLQCLSEGNAMMMTALRADNDTARAELSAAQERGDFFRTMMNLSADALAVARGDDAEKGRYLMGALRDSERDLAAAQGLIGEARQFLEHVHDGAGHSGIIPEEEWCCRCFSEKERQRGRRMAGKEPLVCRCGLDAFLARLDAAPKARSTTPTMPADRCLHGLHRYCASGDCGFCKRTEYGPCQPPKPEPQTHAFVPSNLRGVGRCGVCGKPATDPCHTPKSPTETPDIPPRPWRYAYFGTDDWAILSTCHVAGRIETKATAQLIVDAVNAYAPPPAPESAAPTPDYTLLDALKGAGDMALRYPSESAAKPTPPPSLLCPWCKQHFDSMGYSASEFDYCPLCRGSFSFGKPTVARVSPAADKGGR